MTTNLIQQTFGRRSSTAGNTGFASGGVTCKLGAFCFVPSEMLVDSFVLRNPPESKARKPLARNNQSPASKTSPHSHSNRTRITHARCTRSSIFAACSPRFGSGCNFLNPLPKGMLIAARSMEVFPPQFFPLICTTFHLNPPAAALPHRQCFS